MADGRSLVAALALGADAINMGTRFVATQEAPVHENIKNAIVSATERDTRLIMRGLRNTERVLNNRAFEQVLEKEAELGSAVSFQDIASLVTGVYARVMRQGEVDAGPWSCGLVVGLINDVPSVRDLINRIMQEAEKIISQRLCCLFANAET